jgi:fatty acid-binding protein DegV
MKTDDIPDDIIEQYNLKEKVSKDRFVFVEIRRGMCGLPQARHIAQELLEKRLNARGHHQSKFTPGLWTHETRSTNICIPGR